MSQQILTFLSLLLSATVRGQSDKNLLAYKDSIYYTERNIILTDKQFSLHQDIWFNVPGVIDEEFAYTLTLVFLEPEAARKRKVLNLSTDTTIVKSTYGVFSVWNWSDENNQVSGKIEITEWKRRRITVKENISVLDIRRNERLKFVGTRTFKRQKGW